MTTSNFRLVGVELYFADLPRAQAFYQQVLGLELAEMQDGHHAKFTTPPGFICLECRGVEDYPSADKAVLFLEVTNLAQAIERRCAAIRSAVVRQAGSCNRVRDALQPLSRCCDPRLRCGWQCDRNARARGRVQRAVGAISFAGLSGPSACARQLY